MRGTRAVLWFFAMPNFVSACSASELPSGRGRTVTLQGVQVALFNNQGTFHACSNSCPHRGGPLAEGDFDGATVTCPWHGFQFDVATGQAADGRAYRIPVYATRVVDGKVEIALS